MAALASSRTGCSRPAACRELSVITWPWLTKIRLRVESSAQFRNDVASACNRKEPEAGERVYVAHYLAGTVESPPPYSLGGGLFKFMPLRLTIDRISDGNGERTTWCCRPGIFARFFPQNELRPKTGRLKSPAWQAKGGRHRNYLGARGSAVMREATGITYKWVREQLSCRWCRYEQKGQRAPHQSLQRPRGHRALHREPSRGSGEAMSKPRRH